ncbi:MAG: hypothetical protein DYG89_32075 [Caldilinea sp. CFX5]|nr:hypothetical protein [Caldilinea sp. CFX5]
MVIIVRVLTVVYGFLLFFPIPPIQPFLPRPPRAVPTQPAVTQRQPAHVTVISTQPHSQTTSHNGETELQWLYTRVAARSLGEGAFALAEIACTIKNRLHISRNSLANVLRAYRARDVTPKPAHVEIVRQVFEGELPCPSTWWYALSLQDTYSWRPHQRPPVKTIKQNERKQILIFDR